jgi:DNA polymerase III sliding clamp (beta) subunit (PCNA family)
MDAQKLFSMMQKTAFVMAKSCDNPVVEMMLIELNHIDGIIHTVATDSHRMVIIGEAAELPILEDVDYTKLVVPPQAVIDFQRVLKPVKGEVIVEVGEYFLRIRAGRTVFTTKLAYEKYLNYREIEKIGNQSGKLFNINKKEIQEILKGFVSLTKSVTLHFLNNELKLVGENASCEAKMSIENDINHVVRFNVKYVLDILQHIEGEFFTIKCVDGEGINKLNDYILMEMG